MKPTNSRNDRAELVTGNSPARQAELCWGGDRIWFPLRIYSQQQTVMLYYLLLYASPEEMQSKGMYEFSIDSTGMQFLKGNFCPSLTRDQARPKLKNNAHRNTVTGKNKRQASVLEILPQNLTASPL